jgi:hypothetical protein
MRDSLASRNIRLCQLLEHLCLALPMCLPFVCLEVASGALVQWPRGVHIQQRGSASHMDLQPNRLLT